ncbi:MAG TPA: tetratricopeptide repeat protein [Pyrinomonadaceae bacterium]|jgi:tetratricopeptide (TPR) repeat protein|nr:tetratricopeptide repeat protein [Pyrinomonadaceae bacterium]
MSLPILPVYVSSTWLDLQPERKAVEQAVQRLRETRFVGMEYFGSRDEDTRRASLDDIDRSSLYVCIVAGRYGSGITEAEYERAGKCKLPRLIYFKDDSTIRDEWRETNTAQAAKLDAFKKKLRKNHLKGPDFKSPDDLAAKVTADIHRWLFDKYLTPKLQAALDGEVSRGEAQALLDATKDLQSLKQDLLDSLRGAGFNVVALGERSVAQSGDDNLAVTGDDNVVVEHAAGDVVHGDKYVVQEAPKPIIPTLHQLRAPVGDFVGREKEIDELLATLRGGASAAISGISGMGGIGKTELAFYVANKLRDTYPDAQLVLDMRGTDERPRDAGDALAACIRAFAGVEQQLPDDLQTLTHIYRSVLEGKRALILLDNAFDSAQTRPLMPPAGSALLVTSRETVALPGMKRVTLEQLEAAEARELLTGIAPRVPADVADRICFLCGYLPLAIRAAGSLLDITRDLAPEEYAEQLQDERQRLKLIGAEGVDLGVEASFGLSYARLTPDAARVFRQLAVFPATFDARAEETVCEDPGHKHLSELLRRNLVRYNEENQRYSLHDLARLFADSRLSDDESHVTHMRHAAHYLTVLWECGDFYEKGGDAIKSAIALFDVERRNIEAGQEWACQHSSGNEAAARLCTRYPDAGVYVLNLRQHLREFISWFEVALAAARQLKDRAYEGRHLGNLGIAYAVLGELRRAVEFHEQALVVLREIGDRRGEGNVLTNLGNAYRNLDEPRRAIEFNEQALIISQEIGDRRGEGNVLGSLGNAYAVLGELRRAVEFHEQALVVLREIGDRYGEGITLGNLGYAYDGLGEPQHAIEFHERQLTIVREIGDRLGEGNALFNTGVALDKLGDRAMAIARVEAALELYEQIEDPWADKARAILAKWRGEA